MKHDIYKDYYYPVILLDKDLKIVYKNGAALAAKMKPRTGTNIRKYMSLKNLKILHDIAVGEAEHQVIELSERPGKCLARPCGDMTALIFFDSLNYIINASAETAAQVNKIAVKYGEQELLYAGDDKKMQKIRGYFMRHIANINSKKTDSEKSYCDIWEFMTNFKNGASPYISRLGGRVSFSIESKNMMFMHRLNESDFLTLNFILASYALSKSVFSTLDIKFEAASGALIYEFLSDAGKSDSIDLELAELIAENNNLKLEFRAFEDNVGKKIQILVRFLYASGLSQVVAGNNIMSSEDIAARAQLELALE